MSPTPPPFPKRNELPDLLRKLIRDERVEDAIDLVVRILDAMSEAHARALLELKRALRARFAKSSERLSPEQLDQLTDLAQDHADAEWAAEPGIEIGDIPKPTFEVDEGQPRDPDRPKDDRPRKGRGKGRRKRGEPRFPKDLARESVVIPVPEAQKNCPQCGNARAVIDYDTQEILEYSPASFRIREVRREKRACSSCKNGVVRAEAPPRVVERGSFGAGVIAQVIVSKFKDALPLYRQQQIYKRQDVHLPRSTLAELVAQGTWLLRAVALRIQERVLAEPYLQTDDTGLRVLDRDHKDNIKRGHLWPYLAGNFAYFDYTPTWGAEGPRKILERFKGYIQIDGYKGYLALFGPDSPRIEVGCMAHARRKFYDSFIAGDELALEMLQLIGALYRIEECATEEKLDPSKRKILRDEQAHPLLDQMEDWLERHAPATPPKSLLGKAIRYMQNRWAALRRYLDDGRLEIDNSRAERLIRRVAIGRKNFLFAGSDAGAERAAIAYTLIASATLHEIDPWAYLTDILEKIAARWPQSEIDALLPDRWKQEHPEAVSTTPPA